LLQAVAPQVMAVIQHATIAQTRTPHRPFLRHRRRPIVHPILRATVVLALVRLHRRRPSFHHHQEKTDSLKK